MESVLEESMRPGLWPFMPASSKPVRGIMRGLSSDTVGRLGARVKASLGEGSRRQQNALRALANTPRAGTP
jgi:hypothetical protein